jgi:hypothetical protein
VLGGYVQQEIGYLHFFARKNRIFYSRDSTRKRLFSKTGSILKNWEFCTENAKGIAVCMMGIFGQREEETSSLCWLCKFGG